VDIKGHSRLGGGGVKTLVGRKGRKQAPSDGGVLEGHYHRRGGQFAEAIHER